MEIQESQHVEVAAAEAGNVNAFYLLKEAPDLRLLPCKVVEGGRGGFKLGPWGAYQYQLEKENHRQAGWRGPH